jgi:5-(aminomethyl)-3-furanmethanol phosphate kinase
MDAIIKVGGSLAEAPSALKNLGVALSQIAKKHQVVEDTGGGRFADNVRDNDATFHLPALTAHRMAILAMDQYGLLLSHVIPEAVICESLREVKKILKNGKVKIFLPSKFLIECDPFEPSWDVTSDSITAFIATELKIAKVVFVTDVDGIYAPESRENANPTLLETVATNDLQKFVTRTSVDKFLPTILSRHVLDCYVVNGRYPERIEAVLSGKETVCTRILSVK